VLFLVHRFLSPWWRRRQVPPKRRFLQEPHGVTSQKTPLFQFCLSWKCMKTASTVSGNRSSLVQWCLTLTDCYLVFPPQPNIAFINAKNYSSLALSLLFCSPNNFTFELCHIWWCFRFLAFLFHNYGTRHIGKSTCLNLKTIAWTGFRRDCARLSRKALFTVPVWFIGPWHSIRF
jgi:hypothetical protein